MVLTLNTEQQNLHDKIVDQSFSKLLVLGSGGVGKSATLCSAMSELARQGVSNMVLCAPTHIARLNIHSKLDKDVSHLIETTTVASLLLKFGIQSDDGMVHFTEGKMDKINKYSVIALDECSMISEQDYMLFIQSKAKIIFLGDWHQLPPVMAKSAKKKADVHTRTGNLEVVTLTQQMRQQGVIHAAAERNRKSVWFPEETQVGESGESITVHETEQSMINTMVDNIVNDSRGYEATYYHRHISYKNKQVQSAGRQVRDRVIKHYFGFDVQKIPFVKDEILMMRENKKSIGYNGELVKVINVKKDTRSSKYPWHSYELIVKGTHGTGMIRAIPPCQTSLVESHLKELQSRLRRHQIAKEIASSKAVLSEIKKIRAHWTTVQTPYSVTTHKSQGSTIENVYLNTLSFAQAPNRQSLLYVGVSRASNSLHVVKVPDHLRLRQSEVNAAYREARAAYQDISGQSYRKVVRYLSIQTGSLEGKRIVTEYLQCLVEDMKQ